MPISEKQGKNKYKPHRLLPLAPIEAESPQSGFARRGLVAESGYTVGK